MDKLVTPFRSQPTLSCRPMSNDTAHRYQCFRQRRSAERAPSRLWPTAPAVLTWGRAKSFARLPPGSDDQRRIVRERRHDVIRAVAGPTDVAQMPQGGCWVEPDLPKTMVNSKARRSSYAAAKKGLGFFGSHILAPFIGAGLTMTAALATRLARVPSTLQRRVMIALGLPRGLA